MQSVTLIFSKSLLALRLRHGNTVYNPVQLLIDHNQDLPSTMRIAIAVLALAFVGVSIARGLLLTIGHRILDIHVLVYDRSL